MKKSLVAIALGAALLTACQSVPAKLNPLSPKTQETAVSNKRFISAYDFATTVQRIQQGVSDKGMTVFGVIDHAKAAQNAGLNMQPAAVIVFGNPKAGTPLMVKDPEFALQLPLKVLVTQTDKGVLVAMTDTKALIAGSKISYAEVENSLAKAEMVIESLVK
ncbi:DUF302 domain-containing protein [Moraxella sp.]|uniref:DUF302 domain-containing protein n=1 Tax=Moraxella sp. TaxID=479 RepID=UPI0026DAE9FF|nr:DUF302 domain-containing protein [Moraxella sp.]MDO4895424.1 DUF302 domain-containing protein [Moraxella sp.]